MSARPDTSEVTQEEFEELFDQDGALEEEVDTVEDDSGEDDQEQEEEGEEDEEGDPQAQEDDDGDEDSDEEEEPESVDWEKAPAALKTEFDSVVQERDRWKKDYSKLQSDFTKRVNAFKEEEKSLPTLKAKAQSLDRFNALLGQHPQLQQLIEREVARLNNPMTAVKIPEGLEKDPAIQYLQQAFMPVIQNLQAELAEAKARVGKVDEWEAKNQDQEAEVQLNGLLDEARGQIKSMFGRDASEDEVTQVLRYMTENDYWKSGKTAAFHVFADQFRKLSQRTSVEKAKAKAKKFPAKMKGMNPSRVGKTRDAETPEEALAMALAEQGVGI